VSKDVGAGENSAKTQVAWEYSLACLRPKLQKGDYELEDHVGENALSLDLSPKFGLTKRIPPTSFLNCLLENA
jgi:hypothetical protein